MGTNGGCPGGHSDRTGAVLAMESSSQLLGYPRIKSGVKPNLRMQLVHKKAGDTTVKLVKRTSEHSGCPPSRA
jgi:hypothetical protein